MFGCGWCEQAVALRVEGFHRFTTHARLTCVRLHRAPPLTGLGIKEPVKAVLTTRVDVIDKTATLWKKSPNPSKSDPSRSPGRNPFAGKLSTGVTQSAYGAPVAAPVAAAAERPPRFEQSEVEIAREFQRSLKKGKADFELLSTASSTTVTPVYDRKAAMRAMLNESTGSSSALGTSGSGFGFVAGTTPVRRDSAGGERRGSDMGTRSRSYGDALDTVGSGPAPEEDVGYEIATAEEMEVATTAFVPTESSPERVLTVKRSWRKPWKKITVDQFGTIVKSARKSSAVAVKPPTSPSQAKSAAVVTGTKSFGSASEKCKYCGKAVYAMEKGEADGMVFHKTCFRCSTCNKMVKMGSYASLEGKIYCKAHFKQLFKLKGNYNEGFGSEQHKHKWDKSKSTGEPL
jgi:hypothetical protein